MRHNQDDEIILNTAIDIALDSNQVRADRHFQSVAFALHKAGSILVDFKLVDPDRLTGR